MNKLIIALGLLLVTMLVAPYAFAQPGYAPMYDNDGNVTWLGGQK